MDLLIISYMVSSIIGITIPMIMIFLWPTIILGFLSQCIGICLDYIDEWGK